MQTPHVLWSKCPFTNLIIISLYSFPNVPAECPQSSSPASSILSGLRARCCSSHFLEFLPPAWSTRQNLIHLSQACFRCHLFHYTTLFATIWCGFPPEYFAWTSPILLLLIPVLLVVLTALHTNYYSGAWYLGFYYELDYVYQLHTSM